MDWDELRYVLAVARDGSLSGAARALGVNHSTVFRRIGAIEKKLGVRLFERLPNGYVPTAAGEEVAGTARQLEEQVQGLERRVSGRDLRLSGTIRLTTTEGLACRLLPPHLTAFRTEYPGIELELVVNNENLSLTKRDADVAIRSTNEPPEELVGRRVATIAYAVYAARDYLQDQAVDFSTADWVGLEESLTGTTPGRWLKQQYPGIQPRYRVNSMLVIMEAVRAGAGLAVLPCLLGDSSPDLVRVGGILPELATGLWLLTHPDLRRSARIRTFLGFLAERIGQERAHLEGDLSPSPASSPESAMLVPGCTG